MKLLRRNTTEFQYRPLDSQTEVKKDGIHAGTYVPTYGQTVTYRGHISTPSGIAQAQLFGLDIRYSHVLLMDNPDADIREGGIVEWKGDSYDVAAVRPSLNVLSVALRRRMKNNAMQNGGD